MMIRRVIDTSASNLPDRERRRFETAGDPMRLRVEIGRQTRGFGVVTRKQKNGGKTGPPEHGLRYLFPPTQSIPGHGEAAVSIPHHDIDPREQEDQVRS